MTSTMVQAWATPSDDGSTIEPLVDGAVAIADEFRSAET